jgi:penicillin-binding protein 2
MSLIFSKPKKHKMGKKQRMGWKDITPINGHKVGNVERRDTKLWKMVYLYILVCIAFASLFVGVVNLQIVQGREQSERSQHNRLEEQEVQPDRGVIYDRNGEKVATNVPSFNVVLDPREVDEKALPALWGLLGGLLEIEPEELDTLYTEALSVDPLIRRIVLEHDVNRDQVLQIRSHADELLGVEIEYSSKRDYIGGAMFSHIIGYTGDATEQQIEKNDDLVLGDVVGQDGIEYRYDKRLRGTKGNKIIELDAAQNVITEYVNEGTAPVPGDSVYLSIDAQVQRELNRILTQGVEKYDAIGGAAVVENVRTGEIIAAVSVPSYDNNLFVGGISSGDYAALISDDEGVPLFNRVISAQIPPGSMFKTIVASAALQEGAITKDTVFNSTGVMYLGAGNSYPFQEYHQHAYGPLNLIGGIAKSSNIYFCHTMLTLGIDKFVPYAEFFGIGSETGIDIPGEASGRVPSPENKIALAETSPWLDPIWYPEGDSCNSAIGQGITMVTPIQVANWAATIANGGKVLQPHFTYAWESAATGEKEIVETKIVREGKVDDANLALVREGMRNSASGPLSVIVPLRDTKIPVAGKTGTAEFGIKDEKGYYTRTHAWVTGFFPYDDPQYSFVVFLEGGGESNNSAQLAAEFINWWADYDKKPQ